MGRSVSVPSRAVEAFFLDWLDFEPDEEGFEPDPEFEWDCLIEDLRENVFGRFQSVVAADWWLDREDHVIAENELAAFGVSEYCGLASVWVVAKTQDFHWSRDHYYEPNLDGLAHRWIAQVWPKVEEMFPYRLGLMGRFSNGEAVYHRVA